MLDTNGQKYFATLIQSNGKKPTIVNVEKEMETKTEEQYVMIEETDSNGNTII